MSPAPVLRVADLAARRVVVWGLGREGAAAARAAVRAGARDVVAVADAAPSAAELEVWTAAGLGAVPVRGLDELLTADAVLLSPGVSRYRSEVDALLDRGVAVTGGTELFLAEQGTRTVVVTGSKGKSTVTRLTAHLLDAVGREALAAGNIGTALLDLLPDRQGLAFEAQQLESYFQSLALSEGDAQGSFASQAEAVDTMVNQLNSDVLDPLRVAPAIALGNGRS